ncbi:MAG: hypothetical protein K1Y36_27260 [Blastocatellia bacterium]|nr:hypothetical protein [Blastocatellia bacterium]
MRPWIGTAWESSRILLGCHSGHFSLPSFRLEEVLWLAETSGVATLLWLTGTYLEPDQAPAGLVRNLVSRIPAVRRNCLAALCDTLADGLTGTNAGWTYDSTLGWINHSRYSQRNPQSHLSLLKPEDFSAIRKFFA